MLCLNSVKNEARHYYHNHLNFLSLSIFLSLLYLCLVPLLLSLSVSSPLLSASLPVNVWEGSYTHCHSQASKGGAWSTQEAKMAWVCESGLWSLELRTRKGGEGADHRQDYATREV